MSGLGQFERKSPARPIAASMAAHLRARPSAFAGIDADRDRAVANRARRVVLGSLGVIQERERTKSRARALALAAILVLLLLIAPLIWEATDSYIAGEHLGDTGNLWSLWACLACPTLLGAILVAGWWRKRG